MSRFPKHALIALAAACAIMLPSCKTVPSAGNKQSIAWDVQHDAFRATPTWKKDSYVNEAVVALLKPESTSIKIHLYEQRGLLLHNDRDIAIDFPVSSGRRAFPTKPGSYTILEKKLSHSSNLYGKYVEKETGKVIESDVDTSIDPMPENANYVGSPMPNFLRLTNHGLGMHIGIVPGYPASHGCVRVPRKIMPKVYGLVQRGTPVTIIKDAPVEEPPAGKSRKKPTLAQNKTAQNKTANTPTIP